MARRNSETAPIARAVSTPMKAPADALLRHSKPLFRVLRAPKEPFGPMPPFAQGEKSPEATAV